MIPEKITIEIKQNNQVAYYNTLGYNTSLHSKLEIMTKDLPKGSHIEIPCTCDYCGETKMKPYKDYVESVSINGLYSCKNCKSIKAQETNLKRYGYTNPVFTLEVQEKIKKTNQERYGVDYVPQSSIVKEKHKNTLLEKYGVDHYSKTDEYKNKYKSTMVERYGVVHPMFLEETKDKIKQTNIKRYGYSNPLKRPEIKAKVVETNNIRYGVDYPTQNKDIMTKVVQSMYRHSTQKTSKQQLYIHHLYKGELNYPCGSYSLDIMLDNYDIEVDCGGHDLSVKLGGVTEKEFQINQLKRNKYVSSEGYKIIRIISRKDRLPSDEVLLNMLSYAKQFFTDNPDRTWISFDIDNSCIHNAYYKSNSEGLPYDYGELRIIKDDDIDETGNITDIPISVTSNSIAV